MSLSQYKRDDALTSRHLMLEDILYQAKVNYQTNKAELDKAKTELSNKTIIAPFSGSVGAKIVSIGNYVNAGAPLVTLTNTQKLFVKYNLPSDKLTQIKLGQDIALTASAVPGKTFHGKVTYISNIVDPNTQTITLHASIDNTDQLLKAGLFAHIQQTLGDNKQAVVVPATTVFADDKGYYVYQTKNGKATQHRITIGERLPDQVIIIKGLSPADTIVVAGQNKLNPGTIVRD